VYIVCLGADLLYKLAISDRQVSLPSTLVILVAGFVKNAVIADNPIINKGVLVSPDIVCALGSSALLELAEQPYCLQVILTNAALSVI
jgi:hypothetical protein